jgi:hypothetical protein
MKTSTLTLFFFITLFVACQKAYDPGISTPDSGGNHNINDYDGLSFDAYRYGVPTQYFSTNDPFFTRPMMLSELDSTQLSHVDILYIWDYGYDQPGFMDPATAAQVWYWNTDVYYFPRLAYSQKTIYYVTNLSEAQFDSAKANPALIDTFFTKRGFEEAPHAIFPNGSCIGGRPSGPPGVPSKSDLKRRQVYGIKNAKTGKRGLLHIRADQRSDWPIPSIDFKTLTDIITEK